MTKAIDHLIIKQLPYLPTLSAQTLFYLSLYHCNLMGLHWTVPCLLKPLPALLVDQTLSCHISHPSFRSCMCTLQPHIIIGECSLALPHNWQMGQRKPERVAVFAGRSNHCTNPVCLWVCCRTLNYILWQQFNSIKKLNERLKYFKRQKSQIYVWKCWVSFVTYDELTL